MGMGHRKRKGGRFNRRRSRRVGDGEDVPRSGIRRHGKSSGGIFSCCSGVLSDPIERNQEDIVALHQAQKQMLASFKLQTTQINFDQDNPVWHASRDQDQTEQVEELQKEQVQLFNDILNQQSKEKDSEKTQVLYKQQCEIIEQMRELQMEGYAYPGGIPAPVTASEQKEKTIELENVSPTS